MCLLSPRYINSSKSFASTCAKFSDIRHSLNFRASEGVSAVAVFVWLPRLNGTGLGCPNSLALRSGEAGCPHRHFGSRSWPSCSRMPRGLVPRFARLAARGGPFRRVNTSETFQSSSSFSIGINGRCGQFSLLDLHLLVEVGEFPARVLEKESAIDGKRGCKHVRKKHSDEDENRGSVLVEQNGFIGNEGT